MCIVNVQALIICQLCPNMQHSQPMHLWGGPSRFWIHNKKVVGSGTQPNGGIQHLSAKTMNEKTTGGNNDVNNVTKLIKRGEWLGLLRGARSLAALALRD